jgi:hypothetical protein
MGLRPLSTESTRPWDDEPWYPSRFDKGAATIVLCAIVFGLAYVIGHGWLVLYHGFIGGYDPFLESDGAERLGAAFSLLPAVLIAIVVTARVGWWIIRSVNRPLRDQKPKDEPIDEVLG